MKINVIPSGLEKYLSFSINNKLHFIDSFQFLSSSLDSLVKSLNKDDFKYLSQEFDNSVMDLVKQKGFCPYEYMSDFESLKKNYVAMKSLVVHKQVQKLMTKNMNMFFKWNLKWKRWTIIMICT